MGLARTVHAQQKQRHTGEVQATRARHSRHIAKNAHVRAAHARERRPRKPQGIRRDTASRGILPHTARTNTVTYHNRTYRLG